MKIQLASTLPFTPVHVVRGHEQPGRVVGVLSRLQDGVDHQIAVHEFRHDENDNIQYKVNMAELCADDSVEDAAGALVWLDHDASMTYKPYAFMVMDAMTKLVGAWDGVVYRTPSGERLRESAFQATLQIVDACVSPKDGLWVMVSVSGEASDAASIPTRAVHQLGWVPVSAS